MLLKPCHLTARRARTLGIISRLQPCRDESRPTLPREKAPPSSQASPKALRECHPATDVLQADATAATARGPRFLLAEATECARASRAPQVSCSDLLCSVRICQGSEMDVREPPRQAGRGRRGRVGADLVSLRVRVGLKTET